MAVSQELRTLYCDVMEETKLRLEVLNGISSDRFKLSLVTAYELFWLELRMICELIALSSLVAHGDIPDTYTKRIQKSYKPHEILNTLADVHPAFYPKPFIFQGTAGSMTKIAILSDGYLTKSELIALHNRSGDMLHRGNMRTLVRKRLIDFSEGHKAATRIINLLQRHYISLIDEKTSHCVLMRAAPLGHVLMVTLDRREASPTWDDWLAKQGI
jgi:hypothetical protein